MDYSKFLIIAALIPLVFGSGCASMLGSKEQTIAIETTMMGDKISDANCSLNNPEGTWLVQTPGSATVHKSASDLTVKCEKNPHQPGTANIKSSANTSMLGNIVLPGSLIWAAIDIKTGAGFDYPPLITIEIGETAIPTTNTGLDLVVAKLPE